MSGKKGNYGGLPCSLACSRTKCLGMVHQESAQISKNKSDSAYVRCGTRSGRARRDTTFFLFS